MVGFPIPGPTSKTNAAIVVYYAWKLYAAYKIQINEALMVGFPIPGPTSKTKCRYRCLLCLETIHSLQNTDK